MVQTCMVNFRWCIWLKFVFKFVFGQRVMARIFLRTTFTFSHNTFFPPHPKHYNSFIFSLSLLFFRMWKGLYNHMEKLTPPRQSPADFLCAVREESQQLEKELTNHQEVPPGGTVHHHHQPGSRQGIQHTDTPVTTPPPPNSASLAPK